MLARNYTVADLIQLYAEMAAHTEPECASTCRRPHSCCSPEYCEATIEYASERWDLTLDRTDHPKLPLMGPSGCTAAPHLRPMCTFHTCDINGLGYKRDDLGFVWTNKYFQIREAIEEKEYKATLRDNHDPKLDLV